LSVAKIKRSGSEEGKKSWKKKASSGYLRRPNTVRQRKGGGEKGGKEGVREGGGGEKNVWVKKRGGGPKSAVKGRKVCHLLFSETGKEEKGDAKKEEARRGVHRPLRKLASPNSRKTGWKKRCGRKKPNHHLMDQNRVDRRRGKRKKREGCEIIFREKKKHLKKRH